MAAPPFPPKKKKPSPDAPDGGKGTPPSKAPAKKKGGKKTPPQLMPFKKTPKGQPGGPQSKQAKNAK